MTDDNFTQDLPPWGSTTKLVVGLSFVALVASLVVQFRGIIGPLILAFILAYALHPLADWVCIRIGLKVAHCCQHRFPCPGRSVRRFVYPDRVGRRPATAKSGSVYPNCCHGFTDVSGRPVDS